MNKYLKAYFRVLLFAAACIPAPAGVNAALPSSDAAFSESLELAGRAAPQTPLPAAETNFPAFPLVYGRSSGKITVGINPNRELLYTILHLTKFSETLRTQQADPLVAAVLKEFAASAGHPAVTDLDTGGKLNWKAGLAYDAFSSYPGYFSALPEGRRLYPYADDFLDRVLRGMPKAEKIAYLDAYWEKVMDFYRTAGFEVFLKKNAGLYQAYVDDVYRNLPATDPVKLHEDFHASYGFEHFYVVPSPLNLPTGGNYGWSIGRSVFNFMGYGFKDPEAVTGLIYHEFGHSFCNPVVEKYAGGLAKYGGLMEGIKDEMGAQAYGNWLTAMRELLVRSVHARFVLKTQGEAAAELFLQREAGKRKFVFIKDFYELLDVYEKDRATYPTLYEFYPRLMESLAGWELAEVTEPLDPGVWTAYGDDGLYVNGLNSKGYAYSAGLRWGDTVTAVDGKKPAASFFLSLEPGRTYALSVTRESGAAETVTLAVLSQTKLRPVKKTAAQ